FQVAILSVDLNFGYLGALISLYPVTGALCNGVICTSFGLTGHVSIILMFFTVAFVGVAILYCFHYKFITIRAMAGRSAPSVRHQLNLAIYLYHTFTVKMYSRFHGRRFNFASLYYLFEDPKYHAFAYDLTMDPQLVVLLAVTTIALFQTMVSVIFIGGYFVLGTFYLLSRQTVAMSERTRQMQRKLMLLVVIQTTIPLTIQLSPLGIYAYSMITLSLTPDINNALFCFQMTHAQVHTVILIATTPSYREPLMM
ncbi:hypothetical protein PFISCL1PPCAC_17850, partial [Pristionchus fissidentatus]